MANLLAKKPISIIMAESQETGAHCLKRALGATNLISLGFGAATVASGCSGYVLSLLQDFGIHIPPWLAGTPGAPFVMYNGRWEALGRISRTLAANHIDPATLPHQTGVFNLVAFLGITLV